MLAAGREVTPGTCGTPGGPERRLVTPKDAVRDARRPVPGRSRLSQDARAQDARTHGWPSPWCPHKPTRSNQRRWRGRACGLCHLAGTATLGPGQATSQAVPLREHRGRVDRRPEAPRGQRQSHMPLRHPKTTTAPAEPVSVPGGSRRALGTLAPPPCPWGPHGSRRWPGRARTGPWALEGHPAPALRPRTRVPAKETGTAVARGAGVTGNGAGRPRGGLAALVQLVGAELTRLAAVRLPRRRALGSPGAGAPRVPAGRGPLGRQGPASGVRPATRRSRRHIGRHSALLGVAAAGKPGLGPEPHTHQAPFHVRRAGPIAGFHSPLNPCFL